MQALGILSRFHQHVLTMALVNMCDRGSPVGEEMHQKYKAWKQLTDETVLNPWHDTHQFTIFLPHLDQSYEGITLEEGLTRGFNVEVKPVEDRSELVYDLFPGGHLVVVLKQSVVDGNFAIAATGVFVRPLALLTLDVIIDPDKGEYQQIVIKHPIIRDYPQNWETQLRSFLKGETPEEELTPVARYVDSTLNQDYRTPRWQDIYSVPSNLISLN